jgi:hypothetical protein
MPEQPKDEIVKVEILKNEVRVGLLKDEYLLLQKFYEDFDARIMTIKGWSATIGLAAIGTGFYQSRFLFLFASAAGLAFWTLDAIWKSFQYSYAPRIVAIETAFRNSDFSSIEPLQIYSAWFASYHRTGPQFLKRMKMGIVFFPHIIPALAGVILFVLACAGWLPVK